MIGSNFKRQAGFTLVELIVAVGVFAAVVVAVSTIFTSVVNSQRKNVNNEEVLDNARFVLENMARAIRQSMITVPAVGGSASGITINHPIKGVIAYSLDNGHIKENTVDLTSDSVFVDNLTFTVSGNSPSDGVQPRVTISISLRNKNQKPGTDTNINLQTTVTLRTLQIQ